MRVRLRYAPLAVTLLLAPACGGSGGDDDGATPATTEVQLSTTSSSTTTTTELVDPSVVPDDPEDIDEEYIEAVLNAHNRVIGDALRLQLEGADISEIVDRYNAIYVPNVADALLTSVLQPSEEVLASLKRPPGDQIIDVVDLRVATSECVEAEVLADFSQVLKSSPSPTPDIVVIRRAVESSAHNETGWISEGVIPGTDPGDAGC